MHVLNMAWICGCLFILVQWLGPSNGLHLVVYLVMPWICGCWFCHLGGSGSDLDMSLMYFGLSLTCEIIWTCNSEWIYDVMNVSTCLMVVNWFLSAMLWWVVYCSMDFNVYCELQCAMSKPAASYDNNILQRFFCPTWYMYSHLRSIFLWCFLYMITMKIERRKSTTHVWSSQNYGDNISFVA